MHTVARATVGAVLASHALRATTAAQSPGTSWTIARTTVTDSGPGTKARAMRSRTQQRDGSVRMSVDMDDVPAGVAGAYTLMTLADSTKLSILPSMKVAMAMRFDLPGGMFKVDSLSVHADREEDLGDGGGYAFRSRARRSGSVLAKRQRGA